ncbi:MAG: hypothetical protein ACRCZY_05965 [Phocaeicola sp.]
MRKETINGHKVEIYDSIDELPIRNFHKYNKYLLVDSGVGSDLNDINTKISLIQNYIEKDIHKAKVELENLRQAMYLINSEVNVKHLAFMALVKSIDGKPTNYSDEGLKETLEIFKEQKKSWFDRLFKAVKKKIDNEIELYFPSQFDDIAIREYYDRLRKRTLLQLDEIIHENNNDKEIGLIDDFLLSLCKPKLFSGRDSVEIKYEKQFEDMCILLTKELSVDVDKLSVLQYYNSFEYLKTINKNKNGRKSY